MATVDRRRRRTQEAALDAAERLFLERGYPAATVEAIAAEADIAVSSIYFNFEGGKRDLYLELARRAMDTSVERLFEADDPDADPFERLLDNGRTYLRFHLEHPLAMRLIALRDVEGSDPRIDETRSFIGTRVWRMFEHLIELVRGAQEHGGNTSADPRALATFLWSAWNGAILLHTNGMLDDRQLESVLNEGATVVLAGLSTSP